MTLLDLVSSKYITSCLHTLTTCKTNLTSDIRIGVKNFNSNQRLPPCFARVTPVRHKQSGFNSAWAKWKTILVTTRNNDYYCVEISVIHIVNSQNSRNILHTVINYCTKYIYWNTDITYIRETVFPTKNTPSSMTPPEARSTDCCVHDSDFKDEGVCVVGNLQSKITFE